MQQDIHGARLRRTLLPLLLLPWLALGSGLGLAAEPTPATSPNSLMELRRHTELAIARGDYRSAEMLIETYLPAAQRLADPTWHVFNGHLIAARVKLALDKTDEAERHSMELSAIAAKAARGGDAMERAIAEITTAQVRQKQGRAAEAAAHARQAITILHRAHERGRITRQTFEAELLAYEEVLIEATSEKSRR
ncbi:MAG: hypothetical protein Q8O25_16485 [Sulfurisoma sp.]|nr:hypothetical protein [Sulfurisoma sp.]